MQSRKCNPELPCTDWVQEMQLRALTKLHCTDAVQEMQSRAALQGLGAGNATAICSARIGCRKCNRELPCLDWVQEMQLRDLNALHCKDGVQEMQL